MRSPNTVVVEGNLARPPEQSGNGPIKFSICWNARKKDDASGEWTSIPNWFDVISWDREQVAAAGLDKGTRVVVTGRLQQDTWEDKETGQKRSKVVVVADNVARTLDRVEQRQDAPDW